jgi:hypothetical protein
LLFARCDCGDGPDAAANSEESSRSIDISRGLSMSCRVAVVVPPGGGSARGVVGVGGFASTFNLLLLTASMEALSFWLSTARFSPGAASVVPVVAGEEERRRGDASHGFLAGCIGTGRRPPRVAWLGVGAVMCGRREGNGRGRVVFKTHKRAQPGLIGNGSSRFGKRLHINFPQNHTHTTLGTTPTRRVWSRLEPYTVKKIKPPQLSLCRGQREERREEGREPGFGAREIKKGFSF